MITRKKGVNQIDFAMAISVMIVVIAFSISYVTSYYSRASPDDKTSELQASSSGIGKILFESPGIPQNWENSNYMPVRVGLKTDFARISMAAAEKGGVNHSFEEADVHVVFDAACANKTYNNSVRVYDQFMGETNFRIYNYTECAANSGFLREANINFLFNMTGNKSSIFWIYYTNNTATQKKTVYNFSYDSSLVGYWKLESVNSTNYTLDSTQNKNDGKLYNYSCNPATCNLTAGQINSGLQFDGADDYVDISSVSGLVASGSYTVSMWVNLADLLGRTFIHLGDAASTNDFELSFLQSTNKFYFSKYASGWIAVNSVTLGQSDVWYHLVGVLNTSSGMYLYVNGVLEDMNPSTTRGAVASQITRLGIGYNSIYYHHGMIDEVRIYNRSLSADEIKALYNYTSTKYVVSSNTIPVVTDKKISALQNLSYDDVKSSLDMKKNFNITACEYSFGRHIPDIVNVISSSYPIMLINSTGSVKACLASVNVW